MRTSYQTAGGRSRCLLTYFFFNDTATTEIYTLSLHDALPIFMWQLYASCTWQAPFTGQRNSTPVCSAAHLPEEDRKSTRLNSSHANISYAVFCLKKKIALSPTEPQYIAVGLDFCATLLSTDEQ